MQLYPLKFSPIFKERIWGGCALRKVFKKDAPADKKIGESWELCDLPNGQSIIANGEFKGKTLNWLINTYPQQITGNTAFCGRFPLLIKILDAQDVLSVQVHPDTAACLRMGKGESKTECWYIITAKKDAVIYKGLKDGITRDSFAAAVENGTVAELLNKIPVKPGQCHFLPAGTPHAIGAGLLIAEIQTPSDTTYRVFDWNRADDSGKPRQLHIDEATESIHFDASADDLSVKETARLADCPYFKVYKGHQLSGCELLLSRGKMRVIIFLTGSGKISDDKITVPYQAGDCILFPFDYQGVVYFASDTEYLTVTSD